MRNFYENKELQKITDYLEAQPDWTFDSRGYTRDGEYRVDLSGEDGYCWVLQRFSDADRDGVATARWVDMDFEGDTLAELQDALVAMRKAGM